jgi:hypothetical protein
VTHSPEPADPGEPLTAAEEQELSALLADALGRGPVPPPPSVTARLDDVLAGLTAERATAERATEERATEERATEERDPSDHATTGTVVRLDARRRRLPRILLAAAAVVVGGYAVGSLGLGGSLTGGDDGGSADSAGGSAGGGRAASRGDAGSVGTEKLSGISRMVVVPTVRRDHLAADVRRVAGRDGRFPPSQPAAQVPSPAPADGPGRKRENRRAACPVPRLTDSQRLYQVRFEGSLAGLVVGPRHGGQVDVTVYSCSTGGVELSRTVPAP